jgi:hypothetical protein
MIPDHVHIALRDSSSPESSPFACVPRGVVTFFSLITVHVTDYHWDRHLYFVIHPYHAQTMTHTPPSDDSILVHLLVVSAL